MLNYQNVIKTADLTLQKLIQSALQNYEMAYVKLEPIRLGDNWRHLLFAETKSGNYFRNNRTQSGKFTCHKCNYSFSSKANLKRHVNGGHSRRELFPCGKCNLSFVSYRSLTNHIQKTHLNWKPLSCDQCDSTFLRKSNLKNL